MNLIQFLFFISFGICAVYLILIAYLCYGWVRTKQPKMSIDKQFKTTVSIIVAARNEEKLISQCIYSILQQSYPKQLFELIIVDDCSEDSTASLVKKYCDEYENIKLLKLNSQVDLTGKKNAIIRGTQESKSELIITTDADCKMGENWLSSIVSFYNSTNAKMIVGPVTLDDEKNIFEKMQTIELIALSAIAGGSLYYNKSVLSNGANLAYPRDIFNEVNGFDGIAEKASGDDVLLMYKIKKKYPDGISYLKSKEALVFTHPEKSYRGLINQRKRWASKGFFNVNMETKIVSLIIILFNTFLFFLMLLGFKSKEALELFAIMFIIKCFIDFLFLFLASSFFDKRKLIGYLFLQQIFYSVYILIIALNSTGKFEWKGRIVS